MSILINTISAIGNNSSAYPLFVRDCGIEAPLKISQTYNQNIKESKNIAKHATREKIIDEYGSSAIWLGGIPFVEKLSNKFIDSKGFSSKVNYKLLDKDSKNNFINPQQNIDVNIDKFKNNKSEDVVKAVNDLKKVKSESVKYKQLVTGKYTAAICLPIALMGFILPKANFALTKYLMKKEQKNTQKNTQNLKINSGSGYDTFNLSKKSQNVSFKGYSSFMTGLSQQQKMAITDGGLGMGRITTARKRNEAIDNAVRAAGMMYLSFVAPKQIDKGLNKIINTVFGINPELDIKVMSNKKFLAKAKSNSLKLPKKSDEIIDFIDNNPKSLFVKIAEEQGEVKMLKSGCRDPRFLVNTEKTFELAKNMDSFAKKANASGNVAKYAKKAITAKSASIFANIIISSSLLAVGLPQLQYALRKILFKTDAEPGLVK